MTYFVRLCTRCGCVRDQSLGPTPPSKTPHEWQVALLWRSLQTDKPIPPPEIRRFLYSGEIKEGDKKTFLMYIEEEPGSQPGQSGEVRANPVANGR
jgi:hypothetical protein